MFQGSVIINEDKKLQDKKTLLKMRRGANVECYPFVF